MNKFWIVLKHTFTTKAMSKTFIVTTLLTSLLVFVVFNLPGIISYFDKDQDEVTQIGVVATDNDFYNEMVNKTETFGFTNLELKPFDDEGTALAEVQNGNIFGFLVVSSTQDGHLLATFKGSNINDNNVLNKLEQVLNQIQFRLQANYLGLTEQEAAQLFANVNIDTELVVNQDVEQKESKSQEEIVQSTVLVYILLFAIYFGVLMYGNMVATEVAKEKSTRVMEILISSVNPIAQMFGKILGIALLGLTQTVFFFLVGYLSMKFGNKTLDLGDMVIDFATIPISTIFYAISFYLLGYLLYSTIAAMLGSLISRIEDLQQTLTPLNLIIVAAFMIAMFGLSAPDAPFIIVTSYIPIFTPMIMFLRVGITSPALWEILIAYGLLILSIIGLAILAAKVYRGGVLMYGKGFSIKNLKKAITFHDEA